MRNKALKVSVAALAVVVAAALVPSLAGSYGKAAAQKDIVDTAVSAGQFTTLVTAVEQAGLVDVLKGEGPFTVFAPTDEAFAALPPGTLEKLLADKDALRAVLTYHVVPGKLMASDVVSKKALATVQGDEAPIDTSSGVKIAGADIVKTDIVCSNGVIHVIDRVITPGS